MSRLFAWFLLLLATVMLLLGVTHLDTAKPAVLLLWLVVGAAAVYALFFKRGQRPENGGQLVKAREMPSRWIGLQAIAEA
jgi:hypothetical protein